MFRFLRIKERAKGEILMGAKIGLQISQPCFYLRGMPTAAIRRRGEGEGFSFKTTSSFSFKLQEIQG